MNEYMNRADLLRTLEERMDWQDAYLPIQFKEWVIDETPTLALKNMQIVRWIPVTERLPRKDQRVLCWLKSGGFIVIRMGLGDMIHIGDDDEITHWMPFPNPPEEDET